jgi:hypothetical protein
MKHLTPIVAVFLIALLAAPYSSAETISAEKRADIEQLLEMTGALEIGKQMSDAVVAQMSQAIMASHPDLPPKIFDILNEEVSGLIGENLPNFVALVTPVYDKHYTDEEIKGLIRFYQTDLGKKTIQVLPVLMQESMMIGQQWGQALAPEIQKRIMERFKAEGIDLSA